MIGKGQMVSQVKRAVMLAAILGMLLGGVGVYAAVATGRMVIGLKQPATPAVIKQIALDTQSQIIQVSPTGAYLLVLPKKKKTPAEIKAASNKIAYVEPEKVMGVVDEQDLILIMPVSRSAANSLLKAAKTNGSK